MNFFPSTLHTFECVASLSHASRSLKKRTDQVYATSVVPHSPAPSLLFNPVLYQKYVDIWPRRTHSKEKDLDCHFKLSVEGRLFSSNNSTNHKGQQRVQEHSAMVCFIHVW